MASFRQRRLVAVILFCFVFTKVAASFVEEAPLYMWHQRRSIENPSLRKRQNASTYDITQAEKLVADAIAQQSKYNAYSSSEPTAQHVKVETLRWSPIRPNQKV